MEQSDDLPLTLVHTQRIVDFDKATKHIEKSLAKVEKTGEKNESTSEKLQCKVLLIVPLYSSR